MKYALIVPEKYRRRGAAAPGGEGDVRRSARARRMRILDVLRLSCDDGPPRVPGPEARRRIVEVLRLQAGLPGTPSDTPLPRGRRETIDLAQFDADRAWMEGRVSARRRLFAQAGLREDEKGLVSCIVCREALAGHAKGPVALSPWAVAIAHSFTCPGRTG